MVVHGCFENLINAKVISGWVYAKHEESILDSLIIHALVDGEKVGETVSNRHRPDFSNIRKDNQFGFEIILAEPVSSIVASQIELTIYTDDGVKIGNIGPSKSFAKKLVREKFNAQLARLMQSFPEGGDAFVKSQLKELLEYEWTDNVPNEPMKETTSVQIPIGSISSRKLVVSGRNGHFFLFAGSNDLDRLYKRRGSVIYKKWTDIIQQRFEIAKNRDIAFLQMVIPEKQSVLPELFPFPLETPTENLAMLEKELSSQPQESLLMLSDILEKDNEKSSIYKKTDSHLSTSGARFITNLALEKLNLAFDLHTTLLQEKLICGDLGNKYTGVKYMESIEIVAANHEPILESQDNPSDNRHIGIKRKWVNPSAKHNKRVLIFGNSFFERGGDSTSLSWWFARLFSEVHFHWNPDCDWNIVDEMKPDILICQTIERFLTKVPNN